MSNDAREAAWQAWLAANPNKPICTHWREAFYAGYDAAQAALAAAQADRNAATVLRDPVALHLHLLRNPLPKRDLLHLLGEDVIAAARTEGARMGIEAAARKACNTWVCLCLEDPYPLADGTRGVIVNTDIIADAIRALDPASISAKAKGDER